jgi:hypothetical protein
MLLYLLGGLYCVVVICVEWEKIMITRCVVIRTTYCVGYIGPPVVV